MNIEKTIKVTLTTKEVNQIIIDYLKDKKDYDITDVEYKIVATDRFGQDQEVKEIVCTGKE